MANSRQRRKRASIKAALMSLAENERDMRIERDKLVKRNLSQPFPKTASERVAMGMGFGSSIGAVINGPSNGRGTQRDKLYSPTKAVQVAAPGYKSENVKPVRIKVDATASSNNRRIAKTR